jgi:hypothetical protein
LRYRIADFSEIARKTFGFSRIFSRKGKTPEEISSGVLILPFSEAETTGS